MEKSKRKSFFVLYVFILSFVIIPIAAMAQQILHGGFPSSIKTLNLSPIARLNSEQKLTLNIDLSLQNQDALMKLIQELYDPNNPKFHQWLKPGEFDEQFGPSQADYQAVIEYTKANGFKIKQLYSDRKMIKISGSVRDIEKAFHIKMMVYKRRSGKGTFFAPDREPSLDLTIPIAHISGLNNIGVLFSYHKEIYDKETSDNKINSGSKDGAYISQDFRAAYNWGNTLTGTGQKVGLVAAGGFHPSDITTYEDNTGLSHHTIESVLLNGADGSPSKYQVEVCLDIEMAIAMAPGLSKVVLYITPVNPDSNEMYFENVLNRMAQDTDVKQFSCSYGLDYGYEYSNPTANNYFQQMITQGQSFFQASGDYSAVTNLTYIFTHNGEPDTVASYFSWPCSNPFITLVGGTDLTTSGPGGYYISESVWNPEGRGYGWTAFGSTGGASSLYSIPQWQLDANPSNTQVSTSKRNSPDVAMVASNIYEYYAGKENIVGGTSASAPLWAGFAALANQHAAIKGRNSIGFINPTVYAIGKGPYYGSAFHDVTVGDNMWEFEDVIPPTSSDPYFYATSGYDLCAGWGSPMGQTLINLLSAIVWSGTKTISSTFTVPSGQTLIILPGTTVRFANGASLLVYGRLNAEGITFTRSGSSGNWGSIQFSGSGASYSSLDYCNIQYGTQINILNGANYVRISGCNITNSSGHGINVSSSSSFQAISNNIANGNTNNGITITGGSQNRCSGNTIYKYQGSSGYHHGAGIKYNSSSGVVTRNDISYYSWGVGAIYGSSLNSNWSYGSDHNNRITNGIYGLKVYQNSWCTFGKVVAGMDDGNGNNSIYGNTYHVEVGNNINDPNTLYASYNWWGSNPPQTSKFLVWPFSSTFIYNPWLTSDPWGQYPLKSRPEQGDVVIGENNKYSEPMSQTGSSSSPNKYLSATDDLQDSLLIGRKFNGKNTNEESVEYLKLYLNNHPNDYASYVVMYGLADSATTPKIIDLFKLYNSKAPKIHKLLLANLYQMEGKIDLAQKENDNIIAENPNTSLAVMAQIKNMLIELYSKNNIDAAKVILNNIKTKSSLIDPMDLADAELAFTTYVDPKTGNMPNAGNPHKNADGQISETIVNEGGLIANYPNPFNPSTMISYKLKSSGHVTLKIYDILGREIVSLVNENQDSGMHSVKFNGTPYASGIYFYKLTAPGINQIKKMLLTK